MSDSSWSRVRELFAAAVDLPATEQAEFVGRECGDDGGLQERVLRLLAADTSTGTPIDDPGRAFASSPTFDYIGHHIGDYEVIRVLGRGGMGVVFEAHQRQPQRSVALKMMASPLVTEAERMRFEFEIEALGQLRHPSIAQVFGAGSWLDEATGRMLPWYAMELIEDAQPIDRYARSHELDARQRIELLTATAAAVQHGHARGILHRDLKPDNILVDPVGRPHLIDFGTARSTQPTSVRFTMTGMMLGTPTYMSPEQFAGDPDAVDAQSDVYSLGVVLYQLLTDQLPLDPGADEWTRFADRVRNTEPMRPSLHRTGLAEHGFDAELDWICLTALAKARSERYASVAQLHDDLRRYLAGESVSAAPPSALLAARRFARRHRAMVIGVASVFLALIAGIITTTWSMFSTEEQRVLANLEKHRAERAATRAETINSYYGEILKLGDPREGKNESRPDWTVREAIQASSEWIDKLEAEPDVEASVRLIAGNALSSFGLFEAAEAHFREVVDEFGGLAPSAELAEALAGLGVLRMRQGGPGVRESRREALRLFRRSRDVLRSIVEDPDARLAESQMKIGSALRGLGELETASESIQRARLTYESLPGDHRRFVAICLSHQADIASRRKDYSGARELYEQAIDRLGAAGLGQHPTMGSLHELLGDVLARGLRDRVGGVGRYESAAAIFIKALGSESVAVGRLHLKIADHLAALARHDELEKYLRVAERVYAKSEPLTSSRLIHIRHRLAGQLQARGEHRAALEFLSAVQKGVDSSGISAVKIRGMRRDYARCVRDAGDPRSAAALLTAQLEELDPKTREGILLRVELARTATSCGNLGSARVLLDALDGEVRALPDRDVIPGFVSLAHGEWLAASRKFAAAETELLAARDRFARLAGARHRFVREALLSLAALADLSGDPAKSKAYRAETKRKR
jgi:eukaryotic-like serine/threonine-protein kinase